jgi:TRAP-type C4-dicarboxylate transport system substrate-binding protein
MRRYILVLLSLLVVAGLLMASCSNTPTTASTSSKPPVSTSTADAPKTTSAAPANAIVLNGQALITNPPPSTGMTSAMVNVCKMIESKSNNQVKINLYWAQSLTPGKELINGLNTGIVDIAIIGPTYEPGKIPLSGVGSLPGISSNVWALAMAYNEALAKEPNLQAEMTKWKLKPIGCALISSTYLVSVKPMRTLADIKGKKLATAGVISDTVLAFNGVPVAMTPTEQFEALQRGTIDGDLIPLGTSMEFKLNEVGKYYTLFDFGIRTYPIVMSQAAFDKLPADVQKNLANWSTDITQIAYDAFFVESDPLAMAALKKQGIEFIDPTQADKDALLKVQSGQADKWASDSDAKGMPGKAVLSTYRDLVSKYEKSSPKK